ncbi:hypothetical protein DNTS_034733 [Danionella cerebrum]|uniref:TM7S3/TM198-like domain-containing protein n=1 Tax=Danionella cerebrum TaxID=2873325 RepID=A0A553NRP7_9TELE|nr:hypothetical protein DNTS_034733 [Danionella translucida]
MGLAGLFVCFLGHRFFKCELFCMGFSFLAFLFFVLITRTTELEYDIRLALTGLVGVVGGVALVMSWWRFGSVLSCVLVVGLILGFLVSSIGNILSCGVVGGYAVILAVNAYTYTSLSYITLDVLKRFLNHNFSRAFISVPLQDIDFIMITLWVVLGVSGMIVQLYREKTRPFFPPSPYIMWKQERERRKTNVLDPSHHKPSLSTRIIARLRQLTRRNESAGETTPLLL